MTKDATENFLNSLPEVRPGERFWFACHPGVVCFNACCAELTMPLTPYDVLRLCQGLDMSSDQFFDEFAVVGCYEDTGFPLLHLRMEETPGKPCPFVTPTGCGIYEHRSSACRTYPLGRATRQEQGGLKEQFFLVREDHCKGFAEGREWTVETWLADQGLEPYNRMNDRYMRLMSRYKDVADGAILSNKHATLGLLCLYQQDRFLDFMRGVDLLSKVSFVGEHAGRPREECIQALFNHPEERLWFAFDWMELVLFGQSDNLAPVTG